MRTRAWQGYLVVGLLVAGAAWVLPTVVRAAPTASRVGCYELLSAAAVAAIVAGVRWHRPAARLPWLLFAAAQLAYFAADVTFYAYHLLLHDARYPAPADGLYLAHYPLFVAGLLLLLRRRSPGRDRDGLLDALIVTTGVGLLAWVFVLGPYVRTAGLSLPVRAVSLAYPLMDLLVVAVAARLAVAGGARPPAYWLLLGSLVALLAADGLYALAQLHGSYQIGQLLDAGWLVSYVGWGAAALHPSMRALSEPGEPAAARLSRARLASVALAAMVAPAVLLVQSVRGEAVDGPVIAAASALLFGLTLLRMRRLAGQAAAQAERARLLHRLGAIIDASPVAIVELDRNNRVQLWNPAAERIYGWPPEEVLGRPHPASLEPGWPAIQPTANGQGHPVRVELRQHRRDGTPIDVELSTAPLQTPGGEPAGVIGVAADITERKRLAEQLHHQAFHDPLTGLPNRTLLHDRTDQAIRGADRELTPAALLLLDLDRFKEVNDTLGHHYGDQLLTLVGERLRGTLREVDTVARLGGDEFAVLLPKIATAEGAVEVAKKLIAGFNEPFLIEGLTLDVEASIGVALYPDHGNDADELLQHADIAMYVAKETHAGFVLFDPAQDQHSPRRLALLGELRRAIDQRQLLLHYQPKVDAHSGQLLGVEALVRWQHPEHGLLPPGEFIPLAERTGLITPLTHYVLDAALHQCHAWQQEGHEVPVAVNVSARRLLDLAFPDEVAGLLATWDVPAQRLVVEITESTIMADPAHALEVLGRLNAMGVQLSIDDFGTGYSSMAYLKTLPVHELKVDRSFVSHMTSNPSDATIVRSTVDLGRNLGLRVVAEGVEDQVTWQALSALGCDAIQGYHAGKPMPVDDLNQWLKQLDSPAPATATRQQPPA